MPDGRHAASAVSAVVGSGGEAAAPVDASAVAAAAVVDVLAKLQLGLEVGILRAKTWKK